MNKIFAAVIGLTLLATGYANAALDPAVTSVVSTAGTDGAMLGGLILAVLIGIAAFKWLRGAK